MIPSLTVAINWLKEKYFDLVYWVDDNPNKALWSFTVLYVGTLAALVF